MNNSSIEVSNAASPSPQPCSRIAKAIALSMALGMAACSNDAPNSEPADSSTPDTPAPTPASDSSKLGPLVERQPLQNSSMVTIRGAMRWNAPTDWTEKDSSGKPFVAAEYLLPGNSEATPSMCRMRNGSAPKDDADIEKTANKRVGDVRVKTSEGKSLLSKVTRTSKELGQYNWAIGTADGAWYDDGTMINPRDPAFVVEDYIGFAAAPIAPGPPFVVNCWGPSATINSQRSAIEAWLVSIEVDPTPNTVG